jgi:class 3 adenylate cyclase/tetratricopeptide (TPR) repeat protein
VAGQLPCADQGWLQLGLEGQGLRPRGHRGDPQQLGGVPAMAHNQPGDVINRRVHFAIGPPSARDRGAPAARGTAGSCGPRTAGFSLCGVSVCVACGRENPPDARFCNGCGADFAAGVVPRQRRKTVTVLFCDVTGSTALGERLELESFRQVMDRYFGVARRVIEDHGGTVEKFIGDAVMAVFGVPVAHEDDALRAVRAAAALREQVAALNREIDAEFGTTISVRTGVNTGQVVAGIEERLAIGDAVNVAARLEQAAAPGEIVVGPQTWWLVRDAVTAEPIGPLQLKGKSQPVAAYRLLQVNGGTGARHSGAPLVGRRNQLQTLGEAFARVIAERSCGLVMMVGMAGVGKSRLTAEFLRGVDARVLTGRCLPYGRGITYWPVVAMVKQLLDFRHGCPAAADLMAHNAKVAAAIRVLLGEQSAVTSPVEIAWAVRKLFESSADLTPLVMVLDDLHWGEPALLDLVEHIADFSRSAAILIVCLARPELFEHRPGWDGAGRNAATMRLGPLEPAETTALIEQLLPVGADMDARLRERVQSAAGGNPLFVEEMLALISESGSREMVVPPTIQALLAARLDQLQAEERTVLECGSVEGESFHRGTIQVMAPQEPDVPGRLMALVRNDLVLPDRAILPGEKAFRFRHLLIRDAAYQALPKTDRAGLHERFARWLEERGAGLVELDEITGYHLEQAFRYRCELGRVEQKARRLAADAATHLGAAGRRAMDRGDTGAAVNLLERAEALLPPQGINLPLQESLIRGLGESGRFDDAISRAERIAGEYSAAGDLVGALRARLAGVRWRENLDPERSHAELRALVDEARPAIEQSGDPAALAALEDAAGYTDYIRCHLAAAFAAFTRAMEHASRAGDLSFESSIRAMAARAVHLGPTPIPEALRWLDAEAAKSTTYLPQLDMRKAALLAEQGRFDEARSLLADTISQMNERGMAFSAAFAMQTAWRIEMLAGDDTAAESAARQGCEQLARLGDQGFLSTQSCQLADALCALGRYEESEQWALRGLKLGSSDDLGTQFLGLSVRSRLLARKGDIAAAFALADQVDALAGTSDDPRDPGDAALNRAELNYLTGDQALAGTMIGQAIQHYKRKGATAYIARAHRLSAIWSSRSPAAAAVTPAQPGKAADGHAH